MSEQKPEESTIAPQTIEEASKKENTQSIIHTQPIGEENSFWGGYFYSITLLILLLGCLYGVLWFLKKHGSGRFAGLSSDFTRQNLRVEAQLPLAPKKTLYVVKYLNRRLLIGATDSSLTLLSEDYTIPEAVSEQDTNSSTPKSPDKDSVKAFEKVMKAFSKEDKPQG